MSALAPYQPPPPVDMRGLRIDLSRGSTTRAFLQANGPLVRLMRPQDVAKVIKGALQIGGEYWRMYKMPLRFTPQSPVVVINRSRWERTKLRVARGRKLPQFVGLTPMNGGTPEMPWWGRNKAKMIVSVFRTAKTRVHTKGPNAGSCVVHMSYGHGILPEKANAFRTLAPSEWAEIQTIMIGYMAEMFGGAVGYEHKRIGMLSSNANKAIKGASGIDYNRYRRQSPRKLGFKLGANARQIGQSYRMRVLGGPS